MPGYIYVPGAGILGCIVRPADECLLQPVPGHSVTPHPADLLAVSWSAICIAVCLVATSASMKRGCARSLGAFPWLRFGLRRQSTCSSTMRPIVADMSRPSSICRAVATESDPSPDCHPDVMAQKLKSACINSKVGYQDGTRTKTWRFAGEHVARGISTDGRAGTRRRATIAAANQFHEAAIGRHAA